MAHSLETKRLVRNLYVGDMLGMEDVAVKTGISLHTCQRWKKEAKSQNDDWDKARTARMVSADGVDAVIQLVLEQFLTTFQSLMAEIKAADGVNALQKGEILAKMSDAFSKTMAAARRFSPEISKHAIAKDILVLQAEFVAAKYPQHLGVIAEITEPFGLYLIENLKS